LAGSETSDTDIVPAVVIGELLTEKILGREMPTEVTVPPVKLALRIPLERDSPFPMEIGPGGDSSVPLLPKRVLPGIDMKFEDACLTSWK
jgi:hypothetical protein